MAAGAHSSSSSGSSSADRATLFPQAIAPPQGGSKRQSATEFQSRSNWNLVKSGKFGHTCGQNPREVWPEAAPALVDLYPLHLRLVARSAEEGQGGLRGDVRTACLCVCLCVPVCVTERGRRRERCGALENEHHVPASRSPLPLSPSSAVRFPFSPCARAAGRRSPRYALRCFACRGESADFRALSTLGVFFSLFSLSSARLASLCRHCSRRPLVVYCSCPVA